ncbi:MAG: PEP-CTERM sorting domain-containing protein [Myxococcota bacterium]
MFSPELRMLVSVIAVLGALAAPAAATPIVYTIEGTFGFIGEGDPLSLAGARLVMVAITDTDDGPIFTSSGSGIATATFDPRGALTATFSNRPGSAPDVVLSYVSQVQALNRFPPGTTADGFMLFQAAAIFEGNAVTMPAFSVFFLDQNFFPGTGTPSLPLFAPSDVAIVAGGFLGSAQGAYTFSDRSFSAVPEPGTALLVALGLGMLAVVRRRR